MDKINPIGWLILLVCFAITYCLLLIIFKPFNYDWNIAWFGIILGIFDLICCLYIFIMNVLNRQHELEEIKKQETLIDRVCEKGF